MQVDLHLVLNTAQYNCGSPPYRGSGLADSACGRISTAINNSNLCPLAVSASLSRLVDWHLALSTALYKCNPRLIAAPASLIRHVGEGATTEIHAFSRLRASLGRQTGTLRLVRHSTNAIHALSRLLPRWFGAWVRVQKQKSMPSRGVGPRWVGRLAPCA